MSDNQWEDDGNNSEETGKGLRAQLEAALARAKEAEDRAAAAEKAQAERSLKDSLTDLGVKPSLGKWILKDGVDPSDQKAVAQWLADNKDDFNIQMPGQEPAAEDESPDFGGTPEPDVHESAAESFNRMQMAQRASRPGDGNRLEAALRELGDDASPEQVLATFAKHGL